MCHAEEAGGQTNLSFPWLYILHFYIVALRESCLKPRSYLHNLAQGRVFINMYKSPLAILAHYTRYYIMPLPIPHFHKATSFKISQHYMHDYITYSSS